jgi:hypothetical protein
VRELCDLLLVGVGAWEKITARYFHEP